MSLTEKKDPISILENIRNRTDLDEKEREYRCEISREILELKKEKNAVILVHNYQIDEIQDIADMHGDSLGLARQATKTDSDVIVLCGVHFMAESAAILNRDKKVLLPAKEAGCPMADMVTPDGLKKMKAEHPDAAVVCYVNTSAEVKAESDICCTSSNAIRVVNSLKQDKVIFIPDMNLGRWVAKHTDKEVILWQGYCFVHHFVSASDIIAAKDEHPDAKVVAHPECRMEVLDLADRICSTHGMFVYAQESDSREFVIVTEKGMLYRLHKENPGKKFYCPSDNLVCANMKRTTLRRLKQSLDNMTHLVTVEPEIAERAVMALERMLAVA